MGTRPITVQVEAQAAETFLTVSEEERQKIQWMLSLCLQYLTARPCSSLQEAMAQAREEAAANGLMPEILESLLNERD